MRIFHYIEIENFKGFGERQRIELEHPAVLIGPNNSGKTTVLQALALWSQAVKVWIDGRRDSTARERTAVPLNRLAIVAVPVPRTRSLWHAGRISTGQGTVYMSITVGVEWHGGACPVRMRFRSMVDEVLYCNPEVESGELVDLELMEHAASIGVHLLYPMSGLETEEPVLRPARIEVLLGRGQTAQVLRNLCLAVYESDADHRRWDQVTARMHRLFGISLTPPTVNAQGVIELSYREPAATEPFDLPMAGRGCLQMLLILAYLASHEGAVLLVDEPDAHFEILRQRQVYILLRDLAAEGGGQVVIVTHSEVLLDEALENDLTLLIGGRVAADSRKGKVEKALRHYGTPHYARAKIAGHVLYVEGSTDVDMLRALAVRLDHAAQAGFDDRLNVYYVENNYPLASIETEIERVEGGYGVKPVEHFGGLSSVVPGLRGLAILDNDGQARRDRDHGAFRQIYWRRYEAENYFVTPELLADFAREKLLGREDVQQDLFAGGHAAVIAATIDGLVLERVFRSNPREFETYRATDGGARRLLWDARTAGFKLSEFAEEFFQRIASATRTPLLLRKGSLHQLIANADLSAIDTEVTEKLDLLLALWRPTQAE